jgi:YVTN family beta-propeller protein
MFMRNHPARIGLGVSLALIACSPLSAQTLAGQNYQIFVSNEKSGDVTVINGSDSKVVATIPVGKRPRHPGES